VSFFPKIASVLESMPSTPCAPSTMIVDWNSGPNSVIRYTLTVNIKPDGETVFVSVGQVVSGQFAGATVVRATAEATLDVTGCRTSDGVRHASGPAALALVG
jgi:hypothetical protein